MASEQDLRQKYREVLAQLESQEAQSGQLEGCLRLLIGRLCLAGRGRDVRLDEELRKIGNLTRNRLEIVQINAALEPLTRAVAALDQISSDTATMLRGSDPQATESTANRHAAGIAAGPESAPAAPAAAPAAPAVTAPATKGAPPLSTTLTQRALHATTQTTRVPASA
ncbi:MAG: hypothetical protein WA825_17595, partial [Steroidobacteraceae bacterium]